MTTHVQHLIGGRLVDSRDAFETINPATGEVLATVASAGQAEVDAAVAAASRTSARAICRARPRKNAAACCAGWAT